MRAILLRNLSAERAGKGEKMSEIDKAAQEYMAAQRVIRALEIFDALPLSLLRKYLEQNDDPEKASATLKYLIRERLVNYERAGKYVSNVCGYEIDIRKIAAFSVYLNLARYEKGRISKARYPFDYTFEIGNRIFPLIDYDENGPRKLNYMRWMRMPRSEEYMVIPVIMIVNDEIEILREKNADGELYLIPKEKFLVASAHFTSDDLGFEYLNISCSEYSAGLKRTRTEDVSMEILLNRSAGSAARQEVQKREKIEVTAEDLREIRKIQEALEAEKFAKLFTGENVEI